MIYENENEKRLITELCDVALRAGGLQNKGAVDFILNNLKPLEKEKKIDLPRKKVMKDKEEVA